MFVRAVAPGVLIALAALALSHSAAPPLPHTALRTLPRGIPHAVDFHGRFGVCDLEMQAEDQYDLIISSLGDAAHTFHVGLIARPLERVERSPTRCRRTAPGVCTAASVAHGLEIEPRCLDSQPPSGIDRRVDTAACERAFFLHVADSPLEDSSGYMCVSTQLAGVGRTARIYLDRQVSPGELRPELISDLLHRLDDAVIPFCTRLIGPPADIDGDGKLAVVLTPWLGRLQGGRSQASGFVRSSDFSRTLAAPFGNQADVLNLNTALPDGAALDTLLVHEVTHAACLSLRLGNDERPQGLPQEHDWLNEAIAHVAENLHGGDWSNLDQRIQRFLDDPAGCPLVVADYYRAGLWRDPGCRGATFLFLRWCVDAQGAPLLHRLASCPSAGVDNIERCTGVEFSALYRQWTLALHDGRLASLDLHERLGSCDLSGVRRMVWRLDEPAPGLSLRGTSTAFVRIDPAKATGVRRVVIDAEPGALMQVTVLRGRRPSATAAALSPTARTETAPPAGRRD